MNRLIICVLNDRQCINYSEREVQLAFWCGGLSQKLSKLSFKNLNYSEVFQTSRNPEGYFLGWNSGAARFLIFFHYNDHGVSVIANVSRIYVEPQLLAKSKCCEKFLRPLVLL